MTVISAELLQYVAKRLARRKAYLNGFLPSDDTRSYEEKHWRECQADAHAAILALMEYAVMPDDGAECTASHRFGK